MLKALSPKNDERKLMKSISVLLNKMGNLLNTISSSIWNRSKITV